MPCYAPIKGWYSKDRNKSGKRSVVFKSDKAFTDRRVDIPCGKCIGCRTDRARSWAIRCWHESQLYDDNCFITLTYSDDCLPANSSLVKSDYQKFMKRLRKRFSSSKIRYFLCGEYGEKYFRPHYHACLFNFDFPDRKVLREGKEFKLYSSEILSALWPSGFSTIGDVSYQSACYVARYIVKKMLGEDSRIYGALGKVPEFVVMSRRPGIGSNWFKKFKSDVFPHDYVVVEGKYLIKPPKFYDELFELDNPSEYTIMKEGRKERALENPKNSGRELMRRGHTKLLLSKRERRTYETERV